MTSRSTRSGAGSPTIREQRTVPATRRNGPKCPQAAAPRPARARRAPTGPRRPPRCPFRRRRCPPTPRSTTRMKSRGVPAPGGDEPPPEERRRRTSSTACGAGRRRSRRGAAPTTRADDAVDAPVDEEPAEEAGEEDILDRLRREQAPPQARSPADDAGDALLTVADLGDWSRRRGRRGAGGDAEPARRRRGLALRRRHRSVGLLFGGLPAGAGPRRDARRRGDAGAEPARERLLRRLRARRRRLSNAGAAHGRGPRRLVGRRRRRGAGARPPSSPSPSEASEAAAARARRWSIGEDAASSDVDAARPAPATPPRDDSSYEDDFAPDTASPTRLPGRRRGAAEPGTTGLAVGTLVEAIYGDTDEWFPGKIEAANADGTYAVAYDDGDREPRVDAAFVRVVLHGGASSSSSSSGSSLRDGERRRDLRGLRDDDERRRGRPPLLPAPSASRPRPRRRRRARGAPLGR